MPQGPRQGYPTQIVDKQSVQLRTGIKVASYLPNMISRLIFNSWRELTRDSFPF